MEDLTKRQQDVLEFIKKYIATHGYPPTVREICKGLNLSSPATVHAHIKNLEQLGYLKNESKKFRTIELLVDNEYLKKEPSDGYSIHLFTLQNKNKKLQEENERLRVKQWQIKELKKEWLDINENATLVFENNNLIKFMNKLEDILKGEDKE